MKWLEPDSPEVPPDLQAAVGGHPLLARSLVRRGLWTPAQALAFLDPSHYEPTSGLELPDLAVAAERLRSAIAHGESILVWGDFDADGLTATALLVEALRQLGARVEWYVPDRHSESHGVHWRSLQPFLGRGIRVLLTCDTGVSAHETVALARAAGLDVLITDHHALPQDLPSAQAVVNPSRLPSEHRLRHLSGVGVAYKLAEVLGVPDRGLDLVALGLVADVALQTGDVRYLLQRGLKALRSQARVGVRALLEVAEVDPQGLDEEHIAYALAPRLNALGRLANASVGVDLFLTEDLALARTIAAQMEALNVRRQFLSRQVTAAAQMQVDGDLQARSSPVLVLAHPEWPAGVLGIAASRLVERYNLPVVLVATPPGEVARGSARSIAEVDIHAALAVHRELFSGFGGHRMAAGFSIPAERLPELRKGLTRTVAEWVGTTPPARELQVQGYFDLHELTLDLFDDLSRLSPFGPGNPPVVLVTKGLRVAAQRVIGRTGEHRRLEVLDETGQAQEVVWWQSADLPLPDGLFDLAYVLRASRLAGERTLQLQWVDGRWEEKAAVEVTKPAVAVEVADYRAVPDPLSAVRALQMQMSLQLWAEAVAVAGSAACGRHGLRPAPVLVVWTAPPAPDVWQEALQRAQPQQVYLFGLDPGLDQPDPFVRRLVGLVKHALSAYAGRLEWGALAEATAHRTQTVKAGLRWLIAHGVASVVAEEDNALIVEGGGREDALAKRAAKLELEELLRETAAYRLHFRHADATQLVSLSQSAKDTGPIA